MDSLTILAIVFLIFYCATSLLSILFPTSKKRFYREIYRIPSRKLSELAAIAIFSGLLSFILIFLESNLQIIIASFFATLLLFSGWILLNEELLKKILLWNENKSDNWVRIYSILRFSIALALLIVLFLS